MLVRQLDEETKKDGVCGVGGREPALDENVVAVSNDDGVDSLDELVTTDKFSFERERSLPIFKERGSACDIRSASVLFDLPLAYV